MDALGWPDGWRRDRFVVLQTGSRTEDREAWTTSLYSTLLADPTTAGVIWFDAADWAILADVPLAGFDVWVDAVAALPVADAALEATFEPWFCDIGRDEPRYPEIQALRSAGHTSGCSAEPRLFCPAEPLTREAAATFLSRALVLGAEAPLDDLVARGWLPACVTGTCPTDPVTRLDLALALAAAVEAPSVPTAFVDLDPATPLGALVEAGWITGCADDTFCAEQVVRVGELAPPEADQGTGRLEPACGIEHPEDGWTSARSTSTCWSRSTRCSRSVRYERRPDGCTGLVGHQPHPDPPP